MTKPRRTPTADEILAQLESTLADFRNNPELAAAQRQLEAAQAAATSAHAHETSCREQRALAGARITRGDLFVLEQRLLEKITEIETKRSGLAARARTDQDTLDRNRLSNARARAAEDLANVRAEIATVRVLPTQKQLLEAPAGLRQAYRSAEAAHVEAAAAAAKTPEPLADARHALQVARTKALATVKTRALQLHGDSIRRQIAAFDLACAENELQQQIAGRLNAALGPSLVDDVALPEFSRAQEGAESRYDHWKQSLRGRAPYAVDAR